MRTAHDWVHAHALPHRVVHRTLRVTLAAATLTSFAACGDGATTPTSAAAPANVLMAEATQFTANGITYPAVSIQNGNSALAVGAHETLTAKLSTPSATWNGAYVSWTSSNSGVVSVAMQNWGSKSGDGAYLTGVTSGTATITGTTRSGTTGSFDITVGSGSSTTPPASAGASGGYPHEPSGFTAFTDRAFNGTNEDGWSSPGGNATIVQDGSAPASPSGVMRVTYPAGLSGGDTPMAQSHSIPGSPTEFYGAIWVKFSSNFVGNGSGVNKILYVWTNDGQYGTPAIYLSAQAYGSESFQPQVRTQDATFTDLGPNMGVQGGYTFPRNAWVKWEFYLKMNSAGQSDGIVRQWMNGVQVSEYTNQKFSPGTAHWTSLQIAPYWGGMGGSITSPQYLYLDHLHGSVH